MAVEEAPTQTDVLILGAGPGGYVAAIRAGQHGLDTVLVEKDAYGGACLNRGCVPSKALITATDKAYDAKHAEVMGIHADPEVDLNSMITWKDEVVSRLTDGVETLCQANGVDLIAGHAEFAGPHEARIHTEGGGQETDSIEFKHAIIATGSRPMEVPGFETDGERIFDSTQILSLTSVPHSLLVVGAGYIGMELSTVFAKLGTKVTVVEMLDSILPNYEDDVSQVVKNRAEELGITFHLGERVQEWSEHDEQLRVMTTNEQGDSMTLDASKVLIAVGREPVTDTMNLEATDVDTDEQGFIQIDDRARTEVESVFAVGDVAGEPMLAHKASREGEVAAGVIAGESTALDHRAVPAVIFTDPEVATVGMTMAEAEKAGFTPGIGQMPMQASGRALTLEEPDGFVRVVADTETEFVLGAQVVGAEASEIIAEIALAIEMGARLEDIAATIHAHPTLTEATMEAAMNARNEAIHTIN